MTSYVLVNFAQEHNITQVSYYLCIVFIQAQDTVPAPVLLSPHPDKFGVALSTMGPLKPNPAKMLLRNEVASRIAALSTDEKKRQSQIIFEKVINHPYYKSSNRVALYMSTDQEVDTAPLIDHVKARGAAAFVPQYAGGKMRMLRLEAGDQHYMEITKHGIAQHSQQQPREDALDSGLDLVITPGLAFSRSGVRLGHGGGYYDKYLAKVRKNSDKVPKVMALAFSCQIVDEVPVDELDQKVDEVISAD